MSFLVDPKPYPIVVEERAQEDPDRLYSIIPKTTKIDDGYTNFTYSQLVKAVDKISWWLDEKLGSSANLETFAYMGPSDHRYTILFLAATKTRRQILLPLFQNSRQAHVNLLTTAKCKALIASDDHMQHWDALGADVADLKKLVIPSFEHIINQDPVKPYPYNRSWDEIQDEPILVQHTSGSTGLPKPIVLTHHMLVVYLAYGNLPLHFIEKKVICPLPPSWGLGFLFYMVLPMNYSLIPILLPIDAPFPMTAEFMDQVHISLPNIDGGVYIPAVLRDLVKSPTYISHMSSYKLIMFGGAPLDPETGNILTEFSTILPLLGSTEAGFSGMNTNPDPKDWHWYNFDPESGMRMVPFQDDLCESVYFKHEDPAKARKQMIFHTFPDIEIYYTKDVWKKHPTKEGLWLFSGRTDDFVKLGSMTKFNATYVENIVLRDERIKGVVMGGEGREVPFLLVEVGEGQDEGEVLEHVWGVVEGIRLERGMIMCTERGKPMPRVGSKNTVNRRKTNEEYTEEIEGLYQRRLKLQEGGLQGKM